MRYAMVTNHLRHRDFTNNLTILQRPYGAMPAARRIVRLFYINFQTSYGARWSLGTALDIVRCPACVCTHRTGTGFRASDDVWQAPGTLKNLLTNRPMPVRAPDDARPGTGRCFMNRTCHRWEATCFCRRTYCMCIYISFLKTKNINTNNIFRLSS